jgi:hypothetical protein
MAKRWKRLMNPDYIGAYILDPGQEMTLTIDRVVSEKIKGEKGKIDIKPVIYFKEQIKPMILNNTNCMTIEFLTGSDLPDDWAGHKITIYGTPVKMGTETVEALRIRTKQEVKTQQDTMAMQIKAVADWINTDNAGIKGYLIDKGMDPNVRENIPVIYNQLSSLKKQYMVPK